MRDTPRTDAMVKDHCCEFHAIQLCRSIERELAEAQADAARYRFYTKILFSDRWPKEFTDAQSLDELNDAIDDAMKAGK